MFETASTNMYKRECLTFEHLPHVYALMLNSLVESWYKIFCVLLEIMVLVVTVQGIQPKKRFLVGTAYSFHATFQTNIILYVSHLAECNMPPVRACIVHPVNYHIAVFWSKIFPWIDWQLSMKYSSSFEDYENYRRKSATI